MGVKLFAVYLGGRAPRCNTELHDVVFAIGENIEATYEQLMDQWFGTLEGLHLDSWIELNLVDGHKVEVSKDVPAGCSNLYFINLGAYANAVFGELHANCFLIADGVKQAKARAKSILAKTLPGNVHTDDLHDVDDCIKVARLGGYHIGIKPTTETGTMHPVNGYHVIPEATIYDYSMSKSRPG